MTAWWTRFHCGNSKSGVAVHPLFRSTHVKLEVKATENAGLGVFAASNIKKGDAVAYFPGEFLYSQVNPEAQRLLRMSGVEHPRWVFGLGKTVGPPEFKEGMAYLTHPCMANRINQTGGPAKLGPNNVEFVVTMNHMLLMSGRNEGDTDNIRKLLEEDQEAKLPLVGVFATKVSMHTSPVTHARTPTYI